MGEWISVKDRLPEDPEELVLAIVSGKPRKNVTMIEAINMATYDATYGWTIEKYPEWEGARVSHWMPLPSVPNDWGADEKTDI